MSNIKDISKEKLTAENYSKLTALNNPKMHEFIADAIELAGADSVYVCTDSKADREYIRRQAIKLGEEIQLNIEGHTCHFDGYNDQARDKSKTKYLLPAGSDLGASLNSIEKQAGIEEVRSFLKNSMVGREMLVLFFCLGPIDSDLASDQGWLAEHMFVLGAHGPGGRVTYFAGAFPSACGKTSTSMLPGQTIIGDDIAYLRKKNSQMRCVNVEKGIFGIIRDVDPIDDPIIYEALTNPREVIFSNVLIEDKKKPHWLGMGAELPTEGINHSGQWHKGKKDDKGNEITASHKNARYCLNIADLSNRDPLIDDSNGVPVGGVVYGGRDSDTWNPVEQAFSWKEGIILKGACLESETTAATLGQEGLRTFNLMSNLDFLSIPLGRYIQNNLDFVKGIKNPPLIFSVNYFLKNKDGKYLNGIADKLVWILWAELRVNGDVDGIVTPTGFIPKYEDLAGLFKEKLNKNYTKENYVEQFTIRIQENLAKLERVEKIYTEKVSDTPQIVFETFDEARSRLQAARDKHGDYISPFDLEQQN